MFCCLAGVNYGLMELNILKRDQFWDMDQCQIESSLTKNVSLNLML